MKVFGMLKSLKIEYRSKEKGDLFFKDILLKIRGSFKSPFIFA